MSRSTTPASKAVVGVVATNAEHAVTWFHSDVRVLDPYFYADKRFPADPL